MSSSSRIATVGVLLALIAAGTTGFSLQSVPSPTLRRTSTTSLFLTAEEILARARKASGVPEEEPAPKLFDDDILDDMQSALLKMERRVKEGPGSLSILETEELGVELKRIVDEMHRNPHRRLVKPIQKEKPSEQVAPAPPVAVETPVVAAAVAAPPAAPVSSTLPVGSLAPQEPETTSPAVMDTSMDEGPAYDGHGGMGQPRGTVNTYVIEGMDEMSPEEYQKALQESVSARQRARRASGATTGNKATWDYLTSLNGATGVLKSDGVEHKEVYNDQKVYKPF